MMGNEFFAVNICTKVQSCQHCRFCIDSVRRDQLFLLLQKVSPSNAEVPYTVPIFKLV